MREVFLDDLATRLATHPLRKDFIDEDTALLLVKEFLSESANTFREVFFMEAAEEREVFLQFLAGDFGSQCWLVGEGGVFPAGFSLSEEEVVTWSGGRYDAEAVWAQFDLPPPSRAPYNGSNNPAFNINNNRGGSSMWATYPPGPGPSSIQYNGRPEPPLTDLNINLERSAGPHTGSKDSEVNELTTEPKEPKKGFWKSLFGGLFGSSSSSSRYDSRLSPENTGTGATTLIICRDNNYINNSNEISDLGAESESSSLKNLNNQLKSCNLDLSEKNLTLSERIRTLELALSANEESSQLQNSAVVKDLEVALRRAEALDSELQLAQRHLASVSKERELLAAQLKEEKRSSAEASERTQEDLRLAVLKQQEHWDELVERKAEIARLQTQLEAPAGLDEKVAFLEARHAESLKEAERLGAQVSKKTTEIESLQRENSELRRSCEEQAKSGVEEIELVKKKMQAEKKELLERLNSQVLKKVAELREELSSGMRATTTSSTKLTLRKFASSELHHIGLIFPDLSKYCRTIAETLTRAGEKLQSSESERRKLHNLVLELKGNIRVFCRIRPKSEKETREEAAPEPAVTANDRLNLIRIEAQSKNFEFDRVFGSLSSQQDVFTDVAPLATSVLDGYNACILAYGQTGAGKTHTMRGPKEDPGLYKRVVEALFAQNLLDHSLSSCNGGGASYSTRKFFVTITEIYNEQLRDLLAVNKQEKTPDIRLQANGSVLITNCEEIQVQNCNLFLIDLHHFSIVSFFRFVNFNSELTQVTDADEVLVNLVKADKNRAVGKTDMNEHSSRSHQIVTIRCETIFTSSQQSSSQQQQQQQQSSSSSKIHLIDLAGSENVGKSGATGSALKEAQNINRSLSALGDVIQALQNRQSHVPYRNSKLTMLLKDSLGGDAKVLMIVQCSPATVNMAESLSTLNFASRARQVELGSLKRK